MLRLAKLKIQPRAAPALPIPAAYLLLGHAALLTVACRLLFWPSGVGAPVVSPSALGTLHLLAVGFLLSSVLGVLAQLIPVTLMHEPRNSGRWWVPWAFHAVGLALLVLGFYLWHPALVAIGGLLVLGGLVLWGMRLASSIKGRAQSGMLHLYLATAVLVFAASVVLGALMAGNLAGVLAGTPPAHLLKLHLWFLGVGGFAMLISGIGQQLLPMFAVGPAASAKESLVLYVIWLGALALGAAGSPWGAWLLWSGMLLWLFTSIRTVKGGSPRAKSPALYLVGGAFGYALFGAIVLGLHLWVQRPMGYPTELVVALALLLGWLTSTVLALELKIVPFLLWAHLARVTQHDLGVPKIHRYVNEHQAAACAVLFHSGLLGWLLCLQLAAPASIRQIFVLLVAIGLTGHLLVLDRAFLVARRYLTTWQIGRQAHGA